MRVSSLICAKAFAAFLLFGLINPASGETFTLLPGSTITETGTITVDIGGVITGSGTLQEQAPGSLTGPLSGTIEATAVGSTLQFTGGRVKEINTGNWQPTGLPGAFAFTVTIPFSGPGGSASLKFVGASRDAEDNITGSAPLSGAPGNQTFDTAGLALNQTAGIGDLQTFVCTPTCTDLGTDSESIAGPPADILLTGAGTLTGSGSTRTLSLPISFNSPFSFSTDLPPMTGFPNGVTVTVSGVDSGTGNILAVVVPEPSSWLLLLIGVGGMAAVGRGLRREHTGFHEA